jgi:hypothetical protein
LGGLSFDNTIGLTAGHRSIGSSLPNLLGIHAFHQGFKIALGFDGISRLVVVVGNAHTQATDSVTGCATAVVAQNSFDLRWRDVICGLG